MIRIKYQLYKETNDDLNALQQVLYNRGIPVDRQEEWLYAGWDNISDWRLLDEDKMKQACAMVKDCIDNNKKVQIVIDPDVDGLTSAAILTNYLFMYDSYWTHFNVTHIMHEGKQHGLSDIMDMILSDTSLVICPDSASNDREQHKILADKGIKVLCLDHHECDCDSEDALIINPQINDYPNKAITGAGVTWQFCRAFDKLYAVEPHANDLLDLCAIGMIGDMSNYQEIETRAIVNLGLRNIKNIFVKEMYKKNDYSIQKMHGINYYSTAFYLVPYWNACWRSGTMEEKRLIFDACLLEYQNDLVKSSKRGCKNTVVPLYQEAVLVCDRVKRRQTQAQDEAMESLKDKIQQENLDDNAIILCLMEPGQIEKNLQGLIANKLQASYQKPCAVLTYEKDEDGQEFYRGSMRNYSLSPISDLKAELEKTEEIEFCAGHKAAAGLGIEKNHIDAFIKKFNDQYKEIDQTPSYHVDYVWSNKTIDDNKVLNIGKFDVYGQEIPESLVVVKDIYLNPSMVTLMSPDKHPTLKIQLNNGVNAIKFKSNENEYEKFCEPNTTLTIVAKCAINEWNGTITPQLLIEDFELKKEWVF